MALAQAQPKLYTEEDYYNLPEDVRAELIDGQIYYMAAPSREHQTILSELHIAIGNYLKSTGGSCRVYPAPFAVKLFDDRKNIVEPDISVICNRSRLTDKGCTGAPDWIIEIISTSTASHDYVRKLNLYLDAGVKEYWIIDPRDEKIFVYHFVQPDFKVGTYTFQDRIKVNIYDDLYVNLSELDI